MSQAQSGKNTDSGKQDVIFGSEGTAQADFDLMDRINHEIGLTQLLNGSGHNSDGKTGGVITEENVEHKKSEQLVV